MQLSPLTKLAIGLFVLAGLVAYLVVVELGVNAGVIHYGVRVRDVQLGGLTPDEAAARLDERAEQLMAAPIVLSAEGIDLRLYPSEIGWQPRVPETVDAAMEVGRAGGLGKAVRDRLQAWWKGVRVHWPAGAKALKVEPFVDDVEEQAEALGYSTVRWKIRRKIRKAILQWPREIVPIPLEEGL